MGCADLVPGVSGGTMALILGIYTRLIDALSALSRGDTWRDLVAGRFIAVWRAVDGGFLLALAAGIAAAVGTLPLALEWLLTHHRAAVHAAFFGLIAASAPLVFRRVRRPGAAAWLWALLGAVAAFALVTATPARTPSDGWFLTASGAVAVSALLLPGISGAFILVVLGKYDLILAALSARDVAVLAPFALGMVLGLLAFSRALAFLLARHHDAVMALLAGVLVGSLRKVWPWQEIRGVVSVNVPPPDVAAGASAAGLAILAALLVWLLQRVGETREGA